MKRPSVTAQTTCGGGPTHGTPAFPVPGAGRLGAGLLALAVCLLSLLGGCPTRSPVAQPDAAALGRVVSALEADARSVEKLTTELARATEQAYARAAVTLPTVRSSDYAMAPNGCYYRKVQDGAPAVWVSGVVPIDADLKRTTWLTEGINAELVRVTRAHPAVVQSYYNERRSLNRIYPPFDTLAQYEPKMAIPTFNFYYLADTKHNPERKTVWVNAPYVDPAGRGWMVSCIAPVTVKGRLEGVVGLDVTIARLTETYIPDDGASLIVGPGGVVVSAGSRALKLLNLPATPEHRYAESVKSDQYTPDDYTLLKARTDSVRQAAEQILNRKATQATVTVGDVQASILARPVPRLGWSAWAIASETR